MMKKRLSTLGLVCLMLVGAAHLVCAAPSKIEDMSHKGGKIGAYHALLFGIDTYQDAAIPGVKSSAKGATDLAAVLRQNYGFNTDLIVNSKATGEAVVSAIQLLSKQVGINDTVIIYFSGRGEVEPSGNQGYWYPYDAKSGDVATYVKNETIQNVIRDMNANDILLISDSSYADTFFGSAHKLPGEFTADYYLDLYNRQSRWGITSGTDGSKENGISTFTDRIIQVLKSNEKPHFSLQELYEKIKGDLRKSSVRPPRCRSLRGTGDQGGEPVFVLLPAVLEKLAAAKDAQAKPGDKPAPKDKPIADSTLNLTVNVPGADVIMDGVPLGKGSMAKVPVTPGMHQLEISREGYVTVRRNVLVKRGSAVPVTVDLVKEEVKSTKGNLVVAVSPDNADIRITNLNAAYAPGMLIESGTYTLEITAPLYDKLTREVVVKARETNSFSFKLEPAKSISHKTLGNFVLINPGSFQMGSPDDESVMRNSNETQHKVTLTRRIYMQEKEVTLGQWRSFIKSTNYKTEAEAGEGAHILVDYNWEKDTDYNWGIPGFAQNDKHPVTCVSWNDTQAFVKWMNKNSKDSLSFRLPTEAEWEYACRAGTTSRFFYGPCLSRDQANFDGNAKWENCPVGSSSTSTVEAGQFPPNAWGLYDMHGNVMEWCQDWLGNYPDGEAIDPKGPGSGTTKVVRGGGWTSYSYNSRSAKRFSRSPNTSYSDMGFRLVIEP
jgi:formylglycine-generating enzyme required for sulfatase activity